MKQNTAIRFLLAILLTLVPLFVSRLLGGTITSYATVFFFLVNAFIQGACFQAYLSIEFVNWLQKETTEIRRILDEIKKQK